MNLQDFEARLAALEASNTRHTDAEEIKRLQRIYGYYVERGQLDEVSDLFADSPEVSVQMGGTTTAVGLEQVRTVFSSKRPFGVLEGEKPQDYLHLTIPTSAVVDVHPDGKTAKGRWYVQMYLCDATPGGGACLGVGTYENDYIKEDGKWKILRLCFDDIFLSPYEDGWAKTPSVFHKLAATAGMPEGAAGEPPKKSAPFGEQMPFHYRHPITGR
jgi:hypothetical protein